MEKILIGTGVLNWSKYERQSDRYGSVTLFQGQEEDSKDGVKFINKLKHIEGQKGKLIVEVLETRPSYHIGDLFRGFKPVTPKVGEVIELGDPGPIFFEEAWGHDYVGIKRERDHDWLDPVKLYRAHHQTVNLYFVPVPKNP